MKRSATVLALTLAIGGLVAPISAGGIDLGLKEVLETKRPTDVVSTLVFLWDQGDIPALRSELDQERAPRLVRNEEVVRTLRDTAKLSQGPLSEHFAQLKEAGQIERYEFFWIANAARVDAPREVIEQIAEHPDVQRIYYNMPIKGVTPVEGEPQNKDDGSMIASAEPGLEVINAPEAWAYGYTGEGALVSTLDTGVDGNHPALGSRWRGHHPDYANNPEWAWFDPVTNTNFPQEFSFSSHGTHTMGTAVGGDPGDTIGVAPGAEWIHAAVIDRVNIETTVADAIAAFQWVVNPSGDPGMGIDVPHVCSNSWGLLTVHGYPNCDDLFWEFIDNAEAAGVVMVFAAGNEGNSGLRRPADRATDDFRNLAVAALDPYNANLPIAGFSSKGPTTCTPDGTSATKPDIAAPGVNTRSSVNGGGYGQLSGTSMAAPHIAGAVALIYEACDQLSVDEIKQIMYDSAIDLGSPGKNNSYGWGMVDVLAAVQLAEDMCIPSIKFPQGLPTLIAPNDETEIPIEITSGNEQPIPGSERFFYRMNGGEFIEGSLEKVGDLEFIAHLPAPVCGDEPEFYFQVEGDMGSFVTNPPDAPDEFFTVPVGTVQNVIAYEQTFTSGLPDGWTTEAMWNVTGECIEPSDCTTAEALYFGNAGTCNLDGDGGLNGFAFSAPIQLPPHVPGETITLSFCHWHGMASGERAYLYINNQFIHSFKSTDGAWETYELDVTEYAGEEVELAWRVVINPNTDPEEWLGWQIDNIVISASEVVCDAETCTGDFNGDGVVDVLDMLAILEVWGDCEGCPEDLNGDGTVDVLDLLILLELMGDCPE